jgi:ABC-type antimicrobial peptide transport system permease subunit
MFDQIPNEWDPSMAALIVAAAVVAGLVGALLPAIVAARKQPVEALRYE